MSGLAESIGSFRALTEDVSAHEILRNLPCPAHKKRVGGSCVAVAKAVKPAAKFRPIQGKHQRQVPKGKLTSFHPVKGVKGPVPKARLVAHHPAKPAPAEVKMRSAPPPLPRRPLKCSPGQVAVGGKCLNKPTKGREKTIRPKNPIGGQPGKGSHPSAGWGTAAHVRMTQHAQKKS